MDTISFYKKGTTSPDPIQYIFDEIEKSKQKLEKQLQALLDFQQQLNDYLIGKDL